jgi:hypothetical protein
MCVLICANPGVNDWVTKVTARSQRCVHVLAASCGASKSSAHGDAAEVDWPVLDEASVHRIARGTILRECEWPPNDAAFLAREWKNAFEALTEAWSRLLSLVGLLRR